MEYLTERLREDMSKYGKRKKRCGELCNNRHSNNEKRKECVWNNGQNEEGKGEVRGAEGALHQGVPAPQHTPTPTRRLLCYSCTLNTPPLHPCRLPHNLAVSNELCRIAALHSTHAFHARRIGLSSQSTAHIPHCNYHLHHQYQICCSSTVHFPPLGECGEGLHHTPVPDVSFPPFPDKPYCRRHSKNVYGTALHEPASVTCEVEASPGPVTFRWTFNNTSEHLPIPASAVTSKVSKDCW
ncbi:hypothetical protein E2C01_049138 [Portunus trituberculatus]|uniref:Ig-like domain-containing protein n=1 Tax=Portunus trituberculatus TaxID=210409 RepID=A0A5B7GCD1_PORTR|nr:hypothetical protein [Portunus trituberculatus]